MSGTRRQARILAMQALCQWDVQGEESAEGLENFFAARDATQQAVLHATKMINAFWTERGSIDGHITAASTSWDLSRFSPVERNVIRVAIVEILGKEVPPKVAINEAIEIGREYGGADAPRFINGVLDAVFQTLGGQQLQD